MATPTEPEPKSKPPQKPGLKLQTKTPDGIMGNKNPDMQLDDG